MMKFESASVHRFGSRICCQSASTTRDIGPASVRIHTQSL